MADTLLDAFVRVAVDPGSPVEQQLQDLVQRLQAQFGKIGKTLGETMAAGVAGGGGIGGGGIQKSVSGLQGLFKNLREEVLKFQRDVAQIRIQIRPTGDKDLLKRLADVQNRVQSAQSQAARPRASRAERAEALREVQQANQELQRLRTDATSLNARSGTSGGGDTLKQQIFAARQEATGLRQEMQEVGRVVQQSRDAGLIESFRRAREEAGRLAVNVREALQQADFPGADAALTGLRSLSQEFQRLQSGAQARLNFDVELDLQDQKFREELRKVQAEINFQSVVGAGSLSGANKVELAKLRKEVELTELQIEKMNSELVKTPDLLLRLGQAKTQLLTLKDGMVGVFQGAVVANGSMNNLNNNMYQLGQAIEDFSIGFELNGLKGGIRGAANNVSFLINNLGQSLERSQLLNATWRSAIGLISGVGAAVGILVIPRLIEWIRTLDDIDGKTADISKRLERLIDDARAEIEIRLDVKEFQRATEAAKNYEEVLDLLLEKSKEAEKLQFEITGELGEINARGIFEDLDRTFEKINKATEKELKSLRERVADPQALGFGQPGDIAVPVDIGPTEESLKEFEAAFGDSLKEIQEASATLQGRQAAGIIDPESLQTLRKGIERITDASNRLQGTGKLAADEFERIKATVEAILGPITDLVRKADRFNALADEIESQTLGEALIRAGRISEEYQFQLDVLEGRRSKEEEILFQQKQQTDELNRQLEIFKQIRRAQGANEDNTQKLVAAARETALRQQQIDLLRRIKELEGKDPEKSRRGSPDDFFVGVDAGDKEGASLEKELRLLREAVNRNRESLEGGGSGVDAAANVAEVQAAADKALLDKQAAAREAAEKELDTVLSRLAKSAERALSLDEEPREKELDRIDKEVRAAQDRRKKALEGIDSGETDIRRTPRSQQIREERNRRREEREQEERDRASIPGLAPNRATEREEARSRAAEEKQRREDERNQVKQADRDELNRLNALDDQILDVTDQINKAFGSERDRLRSTLENLQRESDQGWEQRLQRRDEQRESGLLENPWADEDLIRNQTEGARNAAELAKAMKDGLPFTSETIEKLLEASNKTLEAINQGIGKFDTAARVS